MAADEQQSRYDETRRQFDEMGPEDQARFLVEATASALAHGIERAGRALADGLEDAVRRARRRSAERSHDGPGAAEPETAQRQHPRTGAHNGPRRDE